MCENNYSNTNLRRESQTRSSLSPDSFSNSIITSAEREVKDSRLETTKC